MKKVSVRDLRQSFPKIERMLNDGETLTITKRDKPVAILTRAPDARVVPSPDDIRARWSRSIQPPQEQ